MGKKNRQEEYEEDLGGDDQDEQDAYMDQGYDDNKNNAAAYEEDIRDLINCRDHIPTTEKEKDLAACTGCKLIQAIR